MRSPNRGAFSSSLCNYGLLRRGCRSATHVMSFWCRLRPASSSPWRPRLHPCPRPSPFVVVAVLHHVIPTTTSRRRMSLGEGDANHASSSPVKRWLKKITYPLNDDDCVVGGGGDGDGDGGDEVQGLLSPSPPSSLSSVHPSKSSLLPSFSPRVVGFVGQRPRLSPSRPQLPKHVLNTPLSCLCAFLESVVFVCGVVLFCV
jgi:hypothetical protein